MKSPTKSPTKSPAKSPASLRERKKQRSRADILAAASDLINHRGYRAAKMRDIAETANVSYQTLYNYFPNKAFIVQALLVQDAHVIDQKIEDAIAGHSGNLLELLNTLTKIRFDAIAHRDRALWREVAIQYLKQTQGFGGVVQLVDSTARNRLEQLLSDAQQCRELDTFVDTELLAHTILCVIDAAFLRYVMHSTSPKVELLQTVRAQIGLVVGPYLTD